jgi:hypothetical protein
MRPLYPPAIAEAPVSSDPYPVVTDVPEFSLNSTLEEIQGHAATAYASSS